MAIIGGYFCLWAGFYFPAEPAFASPKAPYLAASGLMFGLAVRCRPNLLFAAGVALVAVAIYLVKSHQTARIVAFLLPLCAVGIGLAIYNYQRFGNPLEFGVNHLLGQGTNQNRIKLSIHFLRSGLYFFLGCAPDLPVILRQSHAFRYSARARVSGRLLHRTHGRRALSRSVYRGSPSDSASQSCHNATVQHPRIVDRCALRGRLDKDSQRNVTRWISFRDSY